MDGLGLRGWSGANAIAQFASIPQFRLRLEASLAIPDMILACQRKRSAGRENQRLF
jgi:hypothetical protein